MTDSYEFRIAGVISTELVASFAPSSVRTDPAETVFVRPIRDDAELFGVIARCEMLRLKLVGLRQLRSDAHSLDTIAQRG